MALNLSGDAAEFLRGHHVMTLAVQDAEGPWAAALFYACDGEDLVFLSAPGSRHGRALAREPRCAATIQGQEQDWRSIRGIQLEGVAVQLPGEERERARRLYAERFSFVRPEYAPAAILEALARVQWYRLQVQRLFFIDNARGFGKRRVFDA
ncbi:MAG TPA: pyridoxamine 5'-phosphate oxidase family protein [Ramlibacter sp.]|uniref:pyridoxamine 5'-phosphate oxidase family protein n=1 Tax=Ramlibacter sp. TaxID=1917967 RepID=UPI002D7E725F|nr:pyridoxamine 5'-phosphate oxidase family protein [Ramlibacter sp.]HET8748910.1 pyridoxamine 5'-phosphate oxidase family protein [Ramlibacter sp.]